MHARFFIVLLLVVLRASAFGQSVYKFDGRFAQHLIEQKLYDDAFTMLSTLPNTFADQLSSQTLDSIHYLLGKLMYVRQDVNGAILNFSKINSPESPFYVKSQIHAGFLSSYSGDFTSAKRHFLDLQDTSGVSKDLITLQLAGIALMQRDFKAYDSLNNSLKGAHFSFVTAKGELERAATALHSFKKRSGFVAGTLSAILPGTGKIYAGKKGEGIAALLRVGILGLQTWESWRKGPELKHNYRLWAYGSLFFVFYTGNIWGSVMAVPIHRKEFYDTVDAQIRVSLHVPVRTLFD